MVVSWLCPEGHGAYTMPVFHRTSRNRGCVACSRAKTSVPKEGKTLAEAFPEIAAEWDYAANHPLTPSDVAGRSNKKAYFICPRGHGSHQSYISNRAAGHKCPKCAAEDRGPTLRQRNLLRKSLALTSPELAAEWNSERNSVTPRDVIGGSLTKIWWNCPEGHEPYLAAVTHRYHGGTGCPRCSREKVRTHLARFRYTGPRPGTSLGDLHPEVIETWDAERNEGMTVFDVAPSSHRKAHWLCGEGHRYVREVRYRTDLKECPCCRAERLQQLRAAA